MKKREMITILATTLLVACGGGESSNEETAKSCKTKAGVEVSCEDIEAAKKVEEMTYEFVSMSSLKGAELEEAIKKNEEVLAKIEPLMVNLNKVTEADPKEMEAFYVKDIATFKSDIANYKQMLEDLKVITISASWEQDPKFPKEKDVMVRFTNTSTKPIFYLGGKMTYLDKDGNVLAEDNVSYYSFNFEPNVEGDVLPSGYEGTSDHGINCEKEKRALISTIKLELDEIRYEK